MELISRMFGMSSVHASAKGSENIWTCANCMCPKNSRKLVEVLPLITVIAGAEGPWPGLLKACVLWFPCSLRVFSRIVQQCG